MTTIPGPGNVNGAAGGDALSESAATSGKSDFLWCERLAHLDKRINMSYPMITPPLRQTSYWSPSIFETGNASNSNPVFDGLQWDHKMATAAQKHGASSSSENYAVGWSGGLTFQSVDNKVYYVFGKGEHWSPDKAKCKENCDCFPLCSCSGKTFVVKTDQPKGDKGKFGYEVILDDGHRRNIVTQTSSQEQVDAKPQIKEEEFDMPISSNYGYYGPEYGYPYGYDYGNYCDDYMPPQSYSFGTPPSPWAWRPNKPPATSPWRSFYSQ